MCYKLLRFDDKKDLFRSKGLRIIPRLHRGNMVVNHVIHHGRALATLHLNIMSGIHFICTASARPNTG